MHKRLTTRERILEASLRLFNEKSYAATSLTGIAKEVGIAKGNLTYYFPTKKDLALELEQRARAQALDRRSGGARDNPFVDAYVENIWFGLSDWWLYRFLYRDHTQYQGQATGPQPNQPMNADIEKIHASLLNMKRNGMIRTGFVPEFRVLARTLFMVTRFWLDHLREAEGHSEFSAEDQRRGLEHHFSVLLPNLTAPARRQFEVALERLSVGVEVGESKRITKQSIS